MSAIRILHVLGSLNRGGVETWLLRVLQNSDPEAFQIDFLVHSRQVASYDEDVLQQGSKVLRCPYTKNPVAYARRFFELISSNDSYDVIHSHVHHFSGFVLTLGKIAGIPVRIAHSHSDTLATEAKSRPIRRIYLEAMERLIRAHCTNGFAVSEPAAAALFGPEWRMDRRYRVLYCGIDLNSFGGQCDTTVLRTGFGFSQDDIIFGHVGRFSPEKNHLFLLDVAACILSREPRAKFLLVGEGPLRPEVEARAKLLGLNNKVVFAGARTDVSKLMIGVMDSFLLPSLREGIPLVAMEAQAAGLPTIASEALTDEAIVIPQLVHRIPLAEGANSWARTASESAAQPRLKLRQALELIEASRFNIRQGMREMCDVYTRSVSS